MLELQTTRISPAKLHWRDLTYPCSSGGSPTHAARPPWHGARRRIHEAPLATFNYRVRRSSLQLRTPSGGARIGRVPSTSPVQFCRPYQFAFEVRALLSSCCFTDLLRIAFAAAMPPAAIACGCRTSNAARRGVSPFSS